MLQNTISTVFDEKGADNTHTSVQRNRFRHPSPSIFNSMPQGNSLRSAEIKTHWTDKGNRLIKTDDGVWIDPGY